MREYDCLAVKHLVDLELKAQRGADSIHSIDVKRTTEQDVYNVKVYSDQHGLEQAYVVTYSQAANRIVFI